MRLPLDKGVRGIFFHFSQISTEKYRRSNQLNQRIFSPWISETQNLGFTINKSLLFRNLFRKSSNYFGSHSEKVEYFSHLTKLPISCLLLK